MSTTIYFKSNIDPLLKNVTKRKLNFQAEHMTEIILSKWTDQWRSIRIWWLTVVRISLTEVCCPLHSWRLGEPSGTAGLQLSFFRQHHNHLSSYWWTFCLGAIGLLRQTPVEDVEPGLWVLGKPLFYPYLVSSRVWDSWHHQTGTSAVSCHKRKESLQQLGQQTGLT